MKPNHPQYPHHTGWRHHFTGQRLRIFLMLSIAAHLILGLSWGVPAYVKQRQEEATKRAAAQLLADQKAAVEKAETEAKAKAEADTLTDVTKQTKKAVDTMVADLPQKKKEVLWDEIAAKLDPIQEQLARALNDRATTETDLRNLQAELNKQMVTAVNEAINGNAEQDEAAAFMAIVQDRLIPELVRHYSQGMQSKVSQPLHSDTQKLIDESSASMRKTFDDLKGTRDEAGKQFAKFRDELDAAMRSTDAAQDAIARNADGKRADEIKKQIDAASASVTNASTAGASLEKSITAIVTGVGRTQGGDQFVARLNNVKELLGGAMKTVGSTKDALAAGNAAEASKALTALSLDARKTGASWVTAAEEASRAPERGQTALRADVGAASRTTLPEDVKSTFAAAYKAKASERIASVISAAFEKRLGARGIKNDELVKKVTADSKVMLEQRLSDEPLIAAAAVGRLLNYGKAGAEQPVPDAAFAKQFADRSRPIVARGVDEVVSNADVDKRLAELAGERATDPANDAAADRIANAAANMSGGRTSASGISAIGNTVLTDLRASAMQRDDQRAMDGQPIPAEASTRPSVDPLTEEVKNDLREAVKRDVAGLLEKKLSDDQAGKVVEAAATAGDADVTRLAQDVLDRSVSDSDLEAKRTEFSLKMMGHIKGALDDTAAGGVEAELFKQLQGENGQKLAENIRKSVAEQVGGQLTNAFAEAARTERGESDKGVRELRIAIDAVRDTAGKATEIVESSRVRSQRSATEAAAAKKGATVPDTAAVIKGERERLAVVAKTLREVRTGLSDATKNVPVRTEPLKEGLAEIDKAFDNVSKSLADADAAAEKGDPKAFADAVTGAKKALDPYRKSIQDVGADLQAESAQSSARFLKAAQGTLQDRGDEQGVATKVSDAFEEEFRKTTAPKLTDQIVEAYKQKLARAGVDASADEAALRAKVAAELEKQVTGGEPVGKTIVAEVERKGTFKDADKATGEPDTAQFDKAESVADAAVKSGVTAGLSGERGHGEIQRAMGEVKGPSDAIIELKDKFGRMEGQLRAGRGGLLADDGGGDVVEGDGPGSVAGVRKKWQSLMAAAAAQNGSGQGEGQGQGQGQGRGLDNRLGTGPNRNPYNLRFDEEKYQKLIAALKDRDNKLAAGEAFARVGASGQASQVDDDLGSVRPARVVMPTTRPAHRTENDQPYVPTFKSLAFIAAPHVNGTIRVDGNFDDWKDVPAVRLRPERWDGKGQEGLQVADTVPIKIAWDKDGMYFMLEMDDPDRTMRAASRESFWLGDTFEVFVDTMNTKEQARGRGAGQQFWVWPTGCAEDPGWPGGESYVERYGPYRAMPFKTSGQLPVAHERTPTGYRLECRINTEHVRDADLVAGKILGLNMTVETGTRIHYYWSSSKAVGTFGRPDTWGDVLLGGSDGKLEVPEQLTDEDGKGDPAKTTTSVVVGQPMRLRVTDGDMNLNARVADKVMVTVANPSNGDSQVAILKETGPDTGVFEGAVRTALDIGEKVPGLVSVFEGQTMRVAYVDQARANGARDAKVALEVRAASPIINGVATR